MSASTWLEKYWETNILKKRQTINEVPAEGIISHRSYNYSKERANINYFPVTFTFIIALLYCIFLNNTLNYLIGKFHHSIHFFCLRSALKHFYISLKNFTLPHITRPWYFLIYLINFNGTSFKMYFWLVSYPFPY